MNKHYTRHAVHHFSDFESVPFDPKQYSRLKFGCDAVARVFGYQLAESFFAAHTDLLIANECIVIPSPYNQVKNAATVMTEHFINRINELLVEACGRCVEFMTVQRKVSYTNDYGFLSKEMRRGLIDNDTFYFNREYVKGRFLIFIDDVRITGTHEEKLIEILDQRRLKNDAAFLYFAEYHGEQPDIEAKINFAGVTGIADYAKLTTEANHHLIVRPIKYLLSRGDEEFSALLYQLSTEFMSKLYFAALSEGYFRIPQYQQNLARLKLHLGR